VLGVVSQPLFNIDIKNEFKKKLYYRYFPKPTPNPHPLTQSLTTYKYNKITYLLLLIIIIIIIMMMMMMISIHPSLRAYIIHSVYDKPISLQNQTQFTTIYKHTFSGTNTLYVDSIGIHARSSNIFIQFTNISLGRGGVLSIHIILKID
jgi:hypothetical protein